MNLQELRKAIKGLGVIFALITCVCVFGWVWLDWDVGSGLLSVVFGLWGFWLFIALADYLLPKYMPHGKWWNRLSMVILIAEVAGSFATCGMLESKFERDREYADECEECEEEFWDSQTEVWVCAGAYAKAYHKDRFCSGLGRCGGRKEKVSLGDAEEEGLSPCKLCCPRDRENK